MRPFLLGGAALVLLYLASVEVVSLAGGGQDGQTALSVLWAVAGVGALVARPARRRRAAAPRRRSALLAVTATKVFLYDLASLTSLYRVGSLIGLGLLLLCGAFAWQKVRPQARRIRPTLGALTQPPHPPRPATSDDEELLEAETTAILSEYSDAQRLLRVQDELRAGFTRPLARRQGGLDLRLRPHAARPSSLRGRAQARAPARRGGLRDHHRRRAGDHGGRQPGREGGRGDQRRARDRAPAWSRA